MQKLHCTIGEYPSDPAIGERGNSATAGTPFADRVGSMLCPACGAGTACSKRMPWIAAAHRLPGSVSSGAKSFCRDLSGTAW